MAVESNFSVEMEKLKQLLEEPEVVETSTNYKNIFHAITFSHVRLFV